MPIKYTEEQRKNRRGMMVYFYKPEEYEAFKSIAQELDMSLTGLTMTLIRPFIRANMKTMEKYKDKNINYSDYLQTFLTNIVKESLKEGDDNES